MSVGFKSDIGNQRVFLEIGVLDHKARRAIRQTWFALGKDLKSEANREILHGTKTGQVYIVRTKSGGRRRHKSSAPGETHANLSGKLRRSISWIVHGAEQMEFGYGFSTTAANKEPPYSGIEFGIPKRNIKPRPSLANAIEATEGRVQGHFDRAMVREFKRAS
jgi:hypothetical protein